MKSKGNTSRIKSNLIKDIKNAAKFFEYEKDVGTPNFMLTGPSIEAKTGHIQEWTHFMPGNDLETIILILN